MRTLVILAALIGFASAACEQDTEPWLAPSILSPTGPCCTPAGTCTLQPQELCADPNTWYGSGGGCSPNPCSLPPPDGSCCDPAGTCTISTETNCRWAWTEAGDCGPNPCPRPNGSCCSADGTCVVQMQAACSGDWTMFGTCEPSACAEPTGACCAPDGACTVTTHVDCSWAGVWPSSWTSFGACDPNPCPPPLPAGMVLVPAGTFTMGSPANERARSSEEIPHQVTLTKAFYVCDHEVTQSEWRAVMGWSPPSRRGANHPVEMVHWFDAVSYCNERSLAEGLTAAYTITGATYIGDHITTATVSWNTAADGYRLLTEAEWEYACRAAGTTPFCNGAITHTGCSPLDPSLDQVGWYCGNASLATHEVGGKAANAWGLRDMHGNVSEWCWDWYGDHGAEPLTDPTGPASGTDRVTRGGSWTRGARDCRSASRDAGTPGGASITLGLRVSRTAP